MDFGGTPLSPKKSATLPGDINLLSPQKENSKNF
jgi:hypothetical protein